MSGIQEKPLVTISMAAYNQERFIRDSVRGVLAQTYEPLEIVISDDHSTDRTWEIINEEVAAYKASGGIHKNIVLNRNERNLGIALHSNVISALEHGVLRVANAGDDISFPNRVERIVEEWVKDGSRASFIHNGGRKIDERGNDLGPLPEYGITYSLGAATTYLAAPSGFFGPIEFKGAYEDCVYATRAMMIGTELIVPDELMYYRVGVGLSSVKGVRHRLRAANIKGAHANLLACKQNMLDLDRIHGRISEAKWGAVKSFVEQRMAREKARIDLYEGESFLKRWYGYRHIGMDRMRISTFLVRTIFLLPPILADPIFDFLEWVKIRLRGRSCD